MSSSDNDSPVRVVGKSLTTPSLTAPLSSRPIPPLSAQQQPQQQPQQHVLCNDTRRATSPVIGSLRVLPLTPLQKRRQTTGLAGDSVTCNGAEEEHNKPPHIKTLPSPLGNPSLKVEFPTSPEQTLERKPSSKSEDKIPLTDHGVKVVTDQVAHTTKVAKKPSSRLSVEHQLLGVSSSSVSNCSEAVCSGVGGGGGDMITVNGAVQTAGLGKFHIVPFLAAVMVIGIKCFLDGVPDNFGNMLLCMFSIDVVDINILVLLGFVGSMIGAPIGGMLADKFGRRYVVGLGLAALVLVTAVVTGAPNITVLEIFYFFFALLTSAIHPVMLVYVMELSPTKLRFITMLLCKICYSAVAFILPLIMIPLYPSESASQSDMWRIPWGVLIIPIAACIALTFFSPDSPRYNAAKGQTKKAHETVMLMLDTNLGDKLKLDLQSIELFPYSDPAIHGLSLPKLFFRPIRGTTILLATFMIVCNVQYFASHVLTEEFLTNRCNCGVDLTSTEVWSDDLNCSPEGKVCNPRDALGRTCCLDNQCVNATSLADPDTCTHISTCTSLREFGPSSDVTSRCTREGNKTFFYFNSVRNLLYVLGFVLGILLVQYTSRKDAFIHVAFYITFINGLLFAICKFTGGVSILMFGSCLAFNTVIGAVYSISWLYMIEYYPTSLRCTGVGFLAGVGQLGNALGILLSRYTLRYSIGGIYGRLTIHLFLSNLLTVLSFMLELETKRLPMSDRKRTDCLDHKLSVAKT